LGLKTLLGLESFQISESEIMRQIKEAQKKHLSEIEFTSPKKNVKIKLKGLDLPGIMRDDWDYYSKAQ
jgi:hypothetical protein